jgi:hypothetical protein
VTNEAERGCTIHVFASDFFFFNSTLLNNTAAMVWLGFPNGYTAHVVVGAVDGAGNVGRNVSLVWTVDSVPPRTNWTNSGFQAVLRDSSKVLQFGCTKSCTFDYDLDGQGLKPLGNSTVGSDASASSVDTALVSGPPRVTSSTSAVFVFNCSSTLGGPCVVEVRLDASTDWVQVPPMVEYTVAGLVDGLHELEARARHVPATTPAVPCVGWAGLFSRALPSACANHRPLRLLYPPPSQAFDCWGRPYCSHRVLARCSVGDLSAACVFSRVFFSLLGRPPCSPVCYVCNFMRIGFCRTPPLLAFIVSPPAFSELPSSTAEFLVLATSMTTVTLFPTLVNAVTMEVVAVLAPSLVPRILLTDLVPGTTYNLTVGCVDSVGFSCAHNISHLWMSAPCSAIAADTVGSVSAAPVSPGSRLVQWSAARGAAAFEYLLDSDGWIPVPFTGPFIPSSMLVRDGGVT